MSKKSDNIIFKGLFFFCLAISEAFLDLNEPEKEKQDKQTD